MAHAFNVSPDINVMVYRLQKNIYEDARSNEGDFSKTSKNHMYYVKQNGEKRGFYGKIGKNSLTIETITIITCIDAYRGVDITHK